jgi:hypothetical protein
MRIETRISNKSTKENDRIFLKNMRIFLGLAMCLLIIIFIGFSLLIGPRSHRGVSEPQQPHTVLQSNQNLSETNDGKPTILQGEQK